MRAVSGAPVVVAALLGGLLPSAPREPSGPADPDVAATVATVIGSAHHPELTWPLIPDVAPTLREMYAAEPDGLFWFAGAVALAVTLLMFWRQSTREGPAAKEDYVSDMGVSVASGEMAYGEDKPAPPPATIARAGNPR